jgi:serine/threonine protein kinase/tetratricopeptide (TPR) repeat protein
MVPHDDGEGLESTRDHKVLTPGTKVSRYEIVEMLGSGGMGVVYKAEDTRLRRTVALKFLPPDLTRDPEAKKRFVQEAQTASSLEHTNICAIYEIDEAPDGELFIAMSCYDGETLDKKIKQGPMSVEEAVAVALQIAEGLGRAHEAGIIHRDIKPANIMVTPRGEVKILDFGLAKLAGQEKITRAGTTLGTVAYISPEQAHGKEADQRADLWSLGVVLYEMLAGRRPFEGERSLAIIYAILNTEPEPLGSVRSDLSPGLVRVVEKALMKDRDLRYKNASAMIADLKSVKLGLSAGPAAQGGHEHKPSIAVLPFADLSPMHDQEYLCDGISEDIINALNQVAGLRVPARTSSFAFRGKETDIREIGRALNVEKLLEGSVQKAGNRLRITVQLINIADGYHIWSERFDREMDDIFAVQDEISLAVVDRLKGEIKTGEKARVKKRYTESLEAYNLYLKGRWYYARRTVPAFEKAIECYEQAVRIDPKFALAYSGLADVYNDFMDYSDRPASEVYPKARAAVDKALELDDTLAEAYASLGLIRTEYEWDWEGAEEAFRKSIELSPGYPDAHLWYGTLLTFLGRGDEACEQALLAMQLDPLSLPITRNTGAILAVTGRYEDAIKLLQRVIEMDPGYSYTNLFLGRAYLGLGMYEEAVEALRRERALALAPITGIDAWTGFIYAVWGKRDEAEALLAEVVAGAKPGQASHVALIMFGLGYYEEALEWLEKAYEWHEAWLRTIRWFAAACPREAMLKALATPEYKAFFKKMGIPPLMDSDPGLRSISE